MPPRKRTSGRNAQPPAGSGDAPTTSGRRGTDGLGANPDADPVRLHREYVQRRVGGGALPTPEAYARALDQWHRLGGAVRAPAAELHPDAEGRVAAPRARRVLETTEAVEANEASKQAVAGTAEEPAGYDGPLPATEPGDNAAYKDGRS